jgi:hypothetical protein
VGGPGLLRRRLPRVSTGSHRYHCGGRAAPRRWIPLNLGPGGGTATGRASVRCGPPALGGRADVCLAGAMPSPVEGLRVLARLLGDRHVPLPGHAPRAPPRKTSPLTGISDAL